MKVTYRWLQEFTPIAAAPAELAAQLTMAGLEVESISAVAPPFSGVVVGEVLQSGRHPDAEKLSLCQVTTDGTNRLQIVCGAKNVRAGLKVAVAMVGAQLPNQVSIKRAEGQSAARAQGIAVHSRDDRLVDARQELEQVDAFVGMPHQVLAVLCRQQTRRRRVHPWTEGSSGARDDHGGNGVVVLDGEQRLGQRLYEIGIERVQLLRAVQGQKPYGAPRLDQQYLFHACLPIAGDHTAANSGPRLPI